MLQTLKNFFLAIKQTVLSRSKKPLNQKIPTPTMSKHEFFQNFEKILYTHSGGLDFWNQYINLLEKYYGVSFNEAIFRKHYIVFKSELEKAELDYLKLSDSSFSNFSKK